MIGDAQDAALGMLLNQVDRAAQPNPIKDGGIAAGALRIAVLAAGSPNANSKCSGTQSGGEPRHLLDPAAQIGADIFDLALPDALDGGREIVFESSRDTIQRLVGEIERSCQRIGGDGRSPVSFSWRNNWNCTSWKRAPRVSGSICSSGTGASRGRN